METRLRPPTRFWPIFSAIGLLFAWVIFGSVFLWEERLRETYVEDDSRGSEGADIFVMSRMAVGYLGVLTIDWVTFWSLLLTRCPPGRMEWLKLATGLFLFLSIPVHISFACCTGMLAG